MVWVNTSTKVFHMKGTPMYGKTTHGKYVCESAAMAAGDHQAKMSGSGAMGSSMGHSMASPKPRSTGSSIETNQMPNSTSSSSPSP